MDSPRCCPPTTARPGCAPRRIEAEDGHVFAHAPEDATPPEGWSSRDHQVALELARGDDARVGFQGIKRRLDLHPEALRRSLTRLIELGAVEKAEGGYRLTESGHAHIAGANAPRREHPPLPVAAFLLPHPDAGPRLVERFTGRWFDGLHWYGVEPADAETALSWLTEEGATVRLRIGAGVLRIDVAGRLAPPLRAQVAAPLIAAVAAWLRESAGPGLRAAS